MYLHEIKGGEEIRAVYQINGTPYEINAISGYIKRGVYRNGLTIECLPETRELGSRFGDLEIAVSNPDIAVAISAWLQSVWAARVALAAALGEKP